jgi:vacuolar-type H+-ATPase subunit H
MADRAKTQADVESAAIVADARQEETQILRQAEQAAAKLADKARAKTDKKSAAIVADARQKAAQITHKARQTANELTAKEKITKEAKAESARLVADARQKAAEILHKAKEAAAELTEKANAEAKLKAASIVNQSLEIAGRIMSLVNTQEKEARRQKSNSSVDGETFETMGQVNRSCQEMIRFVIDDYRAGILKLDGDEELRKKVESLKEDDDWEALSPDVKALTLVNALKHRAKDP